MQFTAECAGNKSKHLVDKNKSSHSSISKQVMKHQPSDDSKSPGGLMMIVLCMEADTLLVNDISLRR
jgi:hypothetical protein